MQPISYPAQPIATQHQITLHSETIQYTARVGFMPIRHATSGVTEGHLFYIYYSKNGVTDKSKRPVWFLFNGGPGAATIWLHMGAFGPKMVKMEPNGLATPPPYTYVDNPNCLLDTGDLVFIDAMGTGFSRPDKPGYGPNFGGVENDLAAFGEFIRSFLNEYNLWGSPLFVGGESYGTTRAAGLAGYLTDRDIPDQRRDAALGGDRFQRRRGRTAPTQHAADRNHDGAFSQEAGAGSCKSSRWSRSPSRRANLPRANIWNICSTARAPRRPSATRC